MGHMLSTPASALRPWEEHHGCAECEQPVCSCDSVVLAAFPASSAAEVYRPPSSNSDMKSGRKVTSDASWRSAPFAAAGQDARLKDTVITSPNSLVVRPPGSKFKKRGHRAGKACDPNADCSIGCKHTD